MKQVTTDRPLQAALRWLAANSGMSVVNVMRDLVAREVTSHGGALVYEFDREGRGRPRVCGDFMAPEET